ncbi:MAG: iron-sulfur cluster assembly scaffold protein [Patescibacteria group bacterium]
MGSGKGGASHDSDGDPNVLNSDRNDDGQWLNANFDHPDNQWNDNGAFAFLVPEIFLKVENRKIADIKYQIRGCILSKASLSIFSEYIKGKDLKSLKKIKDEDIFKMIGGKPSPSRAKCALFGLEAIKIFLT